MTFMRKSRYIVILAAVVSVLTLTIACMDADHKDMLGTSKNGAHASHVPQPTDVALLILRTHHQSDELKEKNKVIVREVQRRSALEGRLLV